MSLLDDHLAYHDNLRDTLISRFVGLVKYYERIDVNWDLVICARCEQVCIVELSYYAHHMSTFEAENPHKLDWSHSRVCPACIWYERQFELRLQKWEDEQDWDSQDYFEYAEQLGDALWYGAEYEKLRAENALIVRKLVQMKLDQVHQDQTTPIVVPRQVPWSWLENTDYGRFRFA